MLIHTFTLPFLWNSPRFSIDMLMTYVHVNHHISRDALRAMVIETRTFSETIFDFPIGMW